MRRTFFALLVVTVAVVGLHAQRVTYESITVAGTAIGLTDAIIRPPGEPQQTACEGRLETAQVRYRFDGTNPTASEGVLLEVGDILSLRGTTNLVRFRAIRTGGTSGVLKIHCYQEAR